MPPALPLRDLRAAARVLSARRAEVADRYFALLWAWVQTYRKPQDLDPALFMSEEVQASVEYLLRYLRSGDDTWRDLYLGHLLELLHRPGDDKTAVQAARRDALDRSRDWLLELAAPGLDEQGRRTLDTALKAMAGIVAGSLAASVEAHVLLVGDCYFENMVSFLTVPLLARGVVIRQHFVTTRNPVEQREALVRLSKRTFDLVCYSPYTNDCNPAFAGIFRSPNPVRPRAELEALADQAHRQTQATLALLAGLFECSICVQNTNNYKFQDGSPSSVAKALLTWRPRKVTARRASALLDEAMASLNSARDRPLLLMDERAATRGQPELAAARTLYAGVKYHPSALSRRMSAPYQTLILAARLLFSRKVVVVDLDDTVWKGVIGEGEVEHLFDRQTLLRELKRKGILLAIASKNDADKVHWRGGLLQSQDFVAEQIHWEPKPTSLKRIAAELNLKLKDFVFIDDRADQREQVQAAMPEVQVLDATSATTWEMLDWWASAMPEQTEGDRTELYQQRRERESYLGGQTGEALDPAALFAPLGLKVRIRAAGPKELNRVAELINRTNQFNVRASRVTLQQVKAWSQSADHWVLVADARDKFGEMGVVSAMVVELSDESAEVGAWVLSCRVFGYGIETAMLNHVRRLSRQSQRTAVAGRIEKTEHNQPCQEVYASNGFVLQDSVWRCDASEPVSDPAWLEVVVGEELAA
jgi:FkbH-like protein